MPRQIIIHINEINGDGVGDLTYLLLWLKVYSRSFKGCAENRVLLNAAVPEDINKFLLSLAKAEPKNPIFNFVKINSGQIKPIVVDGRRIGVLTKWPEHKIGARPPILLSTIFPDIRDDDRITFVRISFEKCVYYRSMRYAEPIANNFAIQELDSYSAAHAVKTKHASSLGIGKGDFGLLHDVDGINGTEELESYLKQLSPAAKAQIFNNKDISIAAAKKFLTDTPIVFTYVAPATLLHMLQIVFLSPIIQNAISQGKKPLFFITGRFHTVNLPPVIQIAALMGQIRLVHTWLEQEDYDAANALFMNKQTNSIVIPSGDNTLTLCIKTGKFPCYAHTPMVNDTEFQHNFKCGIFKDMLAIMIDHGVDNDWQELPGFNDCLQALKFLSRKEMLPKVNQHYAGMQKFITTEMLQFFSKTLAPYVFENFAFEKHTLPRLLLDIQNATGGLRAEDQRSDTTVQFAASKLAAPSLVQPTSDPNKDAKSQSANESMQPVFGFKPGFLNL